MDAGANENENINKSIKLTAEYGIEKNDWDTFLFCDPLELEELIMEEFSDYVLENEWDFENVVPVAHGASNGSIEFEDGNISFQSEFFLFLDWRNNKDTPSVIKTDTDSWEYDDTNYESLEELELKNAWPDDE